MRKLLCLALLAGVLTVSSGCLPYHTEIPGVLDLRPQAAAGTPATLLTYDKIRFWTLLIVPIGHWDAADGLVLTRDTGLANIRWSSRYSVTDFLINWGATIAIGGIVASVYTAPITVPTWLFFASRSLRIEAAVVPLPRANVGKENEPEVEP